MKQKFSRKWKASRQKRKQRKYLFRSPLHIRHKIMSCNLSKELRKKYGRRSFPLRKNDLVKITRGKFKNKKGKISNVDLKKLRVSIEGIQRQKRDGTKINIYFSPSKLQIQELNLEDKKRIQALGKEKAIEKKEIKQGKKSGEKNVFKKD